MHPAVIFTISMIVSLVAFCAARLMLNLLSDKVIFRSSLVKGSIEKVKTKGLPLTAKYGFLGLVVFGIAPLPGTGIYSGAILSWLMDMKWQTSLLAILPGAVISNFIVTLSVFGIMKGIDVGG